MRIHVLGSCAGGGLPQWNCGGPQSVRARGESPELEPRTQPSIALSADGARWSILNASPDIRHQLARFPGLHPRPGTRDIPLDTVALTNADLDHCMGLLVLREALSYRIVSTPWVRETVLTHNAAWRLLEPAWGQAKLDQPFRLDRDGFLEARFFPVRGKVPGYLKEVATNTNETTAGLRITDTRTSRRLVYAPGLGSIDAGTLAEFEGAELRFVDGTFYRADELRALRPGAPDAHAMMHIPIRGPGGSLETIADLPGRSIYIHMNNTNPILDERSEEAASVRRWGVEIASDGMEIEL
jgi:pyrroloquinoline quinone biosynthesis protein B